MSTNVDYASLYDGYWARADRFGQTSFDSTASVADEVIAAGGKGNVLDVGCGMGDLVCELTSRGVDVRGVDISATAVQHCNRRVPDRFSVASILNLPFPDNSFQMVTSTDCLEHLAPEDVSTALRELTRVSRKYVYLRIATRVDRDHRWHLTVQERSWWEQRLFQQGLRKHALYYDQIPYESLNHDPGEMLFLGEKLTSEAADAYPLERLAQHRGLHMDMSRESGSRSDAHMIRYQLASKYVRPGDVVLDAACGLGYGSFLLAGNTQASRVVGLDNSPYAVEYCQRNFAIQDARLDFGLASLPDDMSELPDNSVDFITSFETLEHLNEVEAFLDQCRRVLRPSGRIVVSVPNDWSDETGKDPNPHHVHVYTWSKLIAQFEQRFVVEGGYRQCADRAKIGSEWATQQRVLQPINLSDPDRDAAEWALLLAMQAPEKSAPTTEIESFIRRGLLAPQGLSNSEQRVRLCEEMVPAVDPACQIEVANILLQETVWNPVDADLTQKQLAKYLHAVSGSEFADLVTDVQHATSATTSWLYRGLLHLKTGNIPDAIREFQKCQVHESLPAEAAAMAVEGCFRLGEVHWHQGQGERAQQAWSSAIRIANRHRDASSAQAADAMSKMYQTSARCHRLLACFQTQDQPPGQISQLLARSTRNSKMAGAPNIVERREVGLDIQHARIEAPNEWSHLLPEQSEIHLHPNEVGCKDHPVAVLDDVAFQGKDLFVGVAEACNPNPSNRGAVVHVVLENENRERVSQKIQLEPRQATPISVRIPGYRSGSIRMMVTAKPRAKNSDYLGVRVRHLGLF